MQAAVGWNVVCNVLIQAQRWSGREQESQQRVQGHGDGHEEEETKVKVWNSFCFTIDDLMIILQSGQKEEGRGGGVK